MSLPRAQSPGPVVLITGAARRIGAAIAQHLHAEGYRVLLHYRASAADAQQLADGFNCMRPDSAAILQADLCDLEALRRLANEAMNHWGQLDALVNNASSFYPTPLEGCNEAQWNELLGSNLRAPFFLIQALAPALSQQRGAVVNLTDIHAQRALTGYPIYSIAKAGLVALTRSLAKELAPAVRVNAVAPGATLWPEGEAALDGAAMEEVLNRIPLGRQGTADEIAASVAFLLKHPYINGQILAVDGGKSLYS